MQRLRANRNAYVPWDALLARCEKSFYDRRCRKNVEDFIALLSHYIPRNPVTKEVKVGRLYEYIRTKLGEMPCGYTVKIAIDKLPGNMKKCSKKQKK